MTKKINLTINTFDKNGLINGIKEVEYSNKDLINIINQFNQNNTLTSKNNNHKTYNKIEEKITSIQKPLKNHKKEPTDFLSIISKKFK